MHRVYGAASAGRDAPYLASDVPPVWKHGYVPLPPPSSPPSSAPNPRRIASEPTNPLVHDLTLSPHPPPLPFIPPRFSPNSTRPNSFEISRHPFYDLHASLCLLFHAGGRKREREKEWSLCALARIPTTNTWAFVDVAPSPPFSRDATMLTPRVEYVFDPSLAGQRILFDLSNRFPRVFVFF